MFLFEWKTAETRFSFFSASEGVSRRKATENDREKSERRAPSNQTIYVEYDSPRKIRFSPRREHNVVFGIVKNTICEGQGH